MKHNELFNDYLKALEESVTARAAYDEAKAKADELYKKYLESLESGAANE